MQSCNKNGYITQLAMKSTTIKFCNKNSHYKGWAQNSITTFKAQQFNIIIYNQLQFNVIQPETLHANVAMICDGQASHQCSTSSRTWEALSVMSSSYFLVCVTEHFLWKIPINSTGIKYGETAKTTFHDQSNNLGTNHMSIFSMERNASRIVYLC